MFPVAVAQASALVIPVLALAVWLYGILPRSSNYSKDDAPAHLPGFSSAHIIPFFHRRFDFINQGFSRAGQAIFQFSLLRKPVIVLSGEVARRDFFQAKDLDLNAGFKFLSGAIPMVPGVTSSLDAKRLAIIHKRLVASQTTERLAQLIPQILEDSLRTIEAWGNSGDLDPFTRLYEIVFQTTVRSLAFTELADNRPMVERLRKLYDTLDTAHTPATVLLPWLPGPSAIRKLIATKCIHDILCKYLDERVKSVSPHDDTPQTLIDAGDERLVIIGFIMGLLVAGARSTGTTASWSLVFLSGHPEWRHKVGEEVRRLINAHATHQLTQRTPPLASLTKTLASISLDAWETQTPTLDAIIRETLRLAQPHVAMRQYLPSPAHGEKEAAPLHLGGKVVPPGAFVMYPFSDVHLSPEIYDDPWRWDPARTEPGQKAPYSYVGMGAGSTMCLGRRLAAIELKLITALFAVGYSDFSAVGHDGAPLAELPRPNWNDILTCRPPAGSCYVRLHTEKDGD